MGGINLPAQSPLTPGPAPPAGWPTLAITIRASSRDIRRCTVSLSRRSLITVTLTLAAVSTAQAQGAPKLLNIFQEVVKPARNSSHEAHEAGWPIAFAKANNPHHSIALTATTGTNDVLYITPYASYAEMEKANDWSAKMPGYQATMDRLAEKDADFLVTTRGMIATLQENNTVGTSNDIAGLHGFYVRTTRVKIGRAADYDEYMQLVKEGYKKAGVDPHIDSYTIASGVAVPTFMSFRGFRSLADMDSWGAAGTKMRAALTQEQRDRMDKLAENSFTARDGEIYVISPKMSYASMETMNADPEFWKSSPVMQLANAKKGGVQQAGAPKAEKKP